MMKDKDLPAYVYGDLKREELVRTGSVILHEYYFANLGGEGKSGGAVLDLIKQWFDCMDVRRRPVSRPLPNASGASVSMMMLRSSATSSSSTTRSTLIVARGREEQGRWCAWLVVGGST